MSDSHTPDELVLFIKSDEWSNVEFGKSWTDGELNIELFVSDDGNTQTWLTVEEAKRLRDWLNRMYP
jgi:hypothetical protein